MTNPPETTVEQWNTRYPIGTPVTAYPSARPEDDPNPERLTTRTRSEAFVFAGTAVVTVDGYERIALTHVDPVQSADSYVPPAKYVRSDNVDCCPHARPVGPGSCEFCWDLVKWEALDGPLAADSAVPSVEPRTAPAAEPPAVWIDGDPLMEAIAVAVWERCARDDADMPQLVLDDPRTIAAAAASAARAVILTEAAECAYRIARRLDEQQHDQRAQGAWDVENVLRAELRRLAAEAPTTATKPAPDGEPYAGDERPCLACNHSMDSHIRVDGEIVCVFEDCSDPTPAEDQQDGVQP